MEVIEFTKNNVRRFPEIIHLKTFPIIFITSSIISKVDTLG
jgi:hypothetical protein